MKFTTDIRFNAREVEELHVLLSAHAGEVTGLSRVVKKVAQQAATVKTLKAKAARPYKKIDADEVREGFMVSFAPIGVNEDDEKRRVEGEVVEFHSSRDGYKAPCFITIRNEHGFKVCHELHPLTEVRRYDT
ncbi:hypothetical protein C9F11_42820 (plasmid) [Streptomyces sp. YIM 121038]|uniref:hypothetical protein n=1 Tax=Streptomyces sp. YIM 121038 TaxID=2136401 RepID=UPI0011105156|nr:hypothetical protein [Streptomyces sp. YIM 121038]QCX82144.1 hypothetical protein C9F11_42820 [Streptomyces sp. YIM 121038]